MDEYSDFNPQYCIEGVTFRFYSSEEIKALSVKEIKNPETFDNLSQPTFGGLYDPALGPTERDDACATCGQSQLHCPGHMGHIELPLTVFNPVFFNTLYKILKSSCYECHRINVPPLLVHLFVNQCKLLDHGKISAVGQLEEVYAQAIHDKVDKAEMANICREMVTNFTEDAIKDAPDVDVLVKNVEALRHKLVVDFVRDQIRRSGKCVHCQARIRPVKQEHHAKVVLMGKLKEDTYETPRKYFSTEKEKLPPLSDISDDSDNEDLQENSQGGEPRAKRPRLNDTVTTPASSKKHDVTLLTAQMIRDHMREVWNQDALLLRRLYSSLATSPSQNPIDIFFLDIVPVPPSRFRPVNVMKGLKYENAQTANLNKVLKSSVIAREVLWEIEKSVAKVPSEEVTSTAVSQIPGKTLAEKLNNAWVRLQTHVNCIFDSELDKLSKDVNPGIKQLLEKKQGLFRKNMMGKRVNYAARSVISPDPNINTCEIGIPEVFATTLTYPQPVTPWNVQELRQMVINGPKKHPGAFMVVNEDGSKVFLDAKKKIQREAIAKQLLKPSTSHSKVTTGIKKVHRHLKNGDVLLINRQPTLHRPSIQAHKARVLPREKTLRLHYANCKAYNADFDGDEMNAHFPQNEIARAEAYNLACTDFQYLVPKDGTPLAGLIQDHMVSGVSLTIRGRYFSKHDYCKLVYSALVDKNSRVKLLPPTILKPHRLWSGKQVLSTVVLNVIPDDKAPLSLTGRAKVPEKSWIKVKKGTSLEATPPYMGESDVIIRQGELLCGVLDKGHYGPTPFGLVHSCYELYGGAVAGNLLTCFGRLFLNFLQMRGFTLGVEDILVTKSADKRRSRIVKKSPDCGNVAVTKGLNLDPMTDDETLQKALKSAHFNTDDRQMREIDMAMRNQTNEIQNQIVNVTMPAGLEKLFPDNNLQLMVVSGAKGSSVNCMQISCLLGQIELEGKRPPPMLSGKTLPSFLPYDVTPRAGGFVTGRFLTGIKQQEYFFHCMAGREGLIDTAVKTSRSGYLQRCLIKHLEGVKVNYDLTVRDCDNSTIQFYYGEDGLDISKTGYLTPKQFPFLLENRNIVHREEHTSETMETKKVKKLLKQIKKWHKKNHAEPGFKLRTSGFLKFCQSAILDVAMETEEDNPPGRTAEDSQKCRAWYQLSDKQRKKYSKTTGLCPAPVLSCVSPYSTSVMQEKLEYIIKNYSSQQLYQHCPSMPGSEFHSLISSKVKRSLVHPGEAVGLLCAQSIGEPSTQMTLNTFHFAGRGEMNVTLGIPRLREILMVGSRNIKTPAMDVPVIVGARDDAKKLQKQFNKVFLSDVIKDVKVAEYLAITGRTKIHRRRVFRVTFSFLPKACYKDRFVLKPQEIINFVETKYVKKLISLIKKKINHMTKMRLLSHGTNKTVRMTAAQRGEGEETGGADEALSSDEEEVDGDDGDAAAEKQRSRKKEEQEYDNDEGNINFDEEETNQEDVVMDDLYPGGNHGDDLEDIGTVIEDDDVAAQSQEKENARVNAVLQLAMEVEKYRYDTKKNLWCEVTVSFPLADSKIDLLALIEKDIQKVVVHEVSGITRCFLGDQPGKHGTEFHLKTEGINMHELYKYDQILELNSLYSNDIHAIADTYGIEAANKVIIKEIQSVFAAYGIEVDYRHLSLLSDYMTFEGTYKPLNRIAMESNPSPLQKMSFETTVHFLVNSSINAGIDNLSSPSAQIVLGKVVTCGTGSHDLMHPLISL